MEKYSLSTKATTILLFLGATTSISAQTKHWEHNVYAGVGIANTLEDGETSRPQPYMWATALTTMSRHSGQRCRVWRFE